MYYPRLRLTVYCLWYRVQMQTRSHANEMDMPLNVFFRSLNNSFRLSIYQTGIWDTLYVLHKQISGYTLFRKTLSSCVETKFNFENHRIHRRTSWILSKKLLDQFLMTRLPMNNPNLVGRIGTPSDQRGISLNNTAMEACTCLERTGPYYNGETFPGINHHYFVAFEHLRVRRQSTLLRLGCDCTSTT